jgi:hypothetical protein
VVSVKVGDRLALRFVNNADDRNFSMHDMTVMEITSTRRGEAVALSRTLLGANGLVHVFDVIDDVWGFNGLERRVAERVMLLELGDASATAAWIARTL